MYIVSAIGILNLLILVALSICMQSNEISAKTQMQVFTGYVVIGGSILMYLAHLIGTFGDKRANTLMAAIQNIKKGDLTQKIVINGKSGFNRMAFKLDSARKDVTNFVDTRQAWSHSLIRLAKTCLLSAKKPLEGCSTTSRNGNSCDSDE